MSPNFRKGAEAVAQSTERSARSGGFRTYAPSIYWNEDQEQRYLLFLNPMDEIVTAALIRYIPQEYTYPDSDGDEVTKEYFEEVIARTDESIGESVDPMVRDWDGAAKPHGIAVAVELEPVIEEDNGRNRVRGFGVKTVTFNRRIRDEDGDLTDETEEVTAPVVGIITQSNYNFYNVVTSFDANDAPIEQCPVKITRVGKDAGTTYSIQGYPDLDVDLTEFVDNIEGISYLNDEMDEVLTELVTLETNEEVALFIGESILAKRLDELVDEDRYNKIYDTIDESLDRFGNKGKKKGKTKATKKPARRSQKRTADAEETGETEEKPKPKRAPRAKPATKQEDPDAVSKLAQLREKQKARAAANKE